jgi:hypothetical protein
MTIQDLDPEIVCLYDVEKVPIRTIAGLLEIHHSVVVSGGPKPRIAGE